MLTVIMYLLGKCDPQNRSYRLLFLWYRGCMFWFDAVTSIVKKLNIYNLTVQKKFMSLVWGESLSDAQERWALLISLILMVHLGSGRHSRGIHLSVVSFLLKSCWGYGNCLYECVRTNQQFVSLTADKNDNTQHGHC